MYQEGRYLRKLANSGGNSIRIHNTKNAKELLDSAQALGLTVMLGLELLPAGPQMDYNDEKAVDRQFNRIQKEIIKYQAHPALLMWSIGNEVGLKLSPRNFFLERRLWIHIDKIARMIHDLDPDHPVTSAIEGAGKLLYAKAFGDNIDLISINSYQSVHTLQEKIKRFGWEKPYIISEYGPTGYWFRERTDWYTYVEQTSNEKRRFMVNAYKAIRSDSNQCLGSYAFYWGQKNECTPTYFSFFTESGDQTELVDGLQYSWTGSWPVKRSSTIISLDINNQPAAESIYLEPGKKCIARFITPAHQSKAVLHWLIEKDDGELYFDPTKNQEKRMVISKGILALPDSRSATNGSQAKGNSGHQFIFKAPVSTGPYRIFLFLENEQKIATANACFYVVD